MKTLPDWYLAELNEVKKKQLKAERLAKIEELARRGTIRHESNDLFFVRAQTS